MSNRTLVYGAGGEPLVQEAVVTEEAKAVLVEAFGALSTAAFPEWQGRGGPQACVNQALQRITALVGPEALTARYPNLQIKRRE